MKKITLPRIILEISLFYDLKIMYTCVILLSFRTSMADNHNANIHTGNRNFNPSVGLRPGVRHVAHLPQF